jgi:hypothetical protein
MLDRQDERLRFQGDPTLAGGQNHPEEDTLAAFIRGELPRDQARAVVRHLLRECSRCVAMTRRLVRPGDPLPGLEALVREMVAGGEPLYDEPIPNPRRDANVSQGEEAARVELRGLVEELDGIRARLVDFHGRLPVPAEETAMLVGEIEMDFPTEVRSVIECVLNDSLRPMLRDLSAAASYQPKKRGGA